jgi:hypothetical protein
MRADDLIRRALNEAVEHYGWITKTGRVLMQQRRPEQDVAGGRHTHERMADQHDLGGTKEDAIENGHHAFSIDGNTIWLHTKGPGSQQIGAFLRKHWAGHEIVIAPESDPTSVHATPDAAIHHLRKVYEATLAQAALSEGEVIRRAFGAGNAMVRHPHETLAPAQIPAEDLTKYAPDSYPAQSARGTSGVKLQRGRKSTTLASTQRIANPDGSFREKSVFNNAFFGKDPAFKASLDRSGQWITRKPVKDRFVVSLSRGFGKEGEDKTQRRPWKDLLTARGLGAFHSHLSTYAREGEDSERTDFAHLAFDNAHSAVETARLLDGDKHYKIRGVQHERQFLPSPGDEGWHDVGTIDHTKGVDSEGRVTYAHSMHGLVDHAKKVGRPHRCPKNDGTGLTSPCSSARGCRNVKLNESSNDRDWIRERPAAWIDPSGHTHDLNGDEHDGWIASPENHEHIKKFGHLVGKPEHWEDEDTEKTFLKMLHGGWVRKVDAGDYEVSTNHEARTVNLIKQHIKRNHPELRDDAFVQVSHPSEDPQKGHNVEIPVRVREEADARGLPIEIRRMSPDTAKKLADALKKGLADRGKEPPRPTPRADRMVRESLGKPVNHGLA